MLGVIAIRPPIVMLSDPSSAVRSRLTLARVESRLPPGPLARLRSGSDPRRVGLDGEAEAFAASDDLAAAGRHRRRYPGLDGRSGSRV